MMETVLIIAIVAIALTTLLAAMELQHQKEDIDALAETIEGADLLRNFISSVWSCSRSSEGGVWIGSGNSGFARGNSLYIPVLAVPIVLYDSII